MIELKNVCKTHINSATSKVQALKDINLALPKQGFVLLMGGNGSGKSTLLSILGGLDYITSGQFLVEGQDYGARTQTDLDDWRAKEVAFVFQNLNLMSEYTVAENIRLGKAMAGEGVTDAEIAQVLSKVHLAGFETRFPKDLSGGESQKAAIARALVKTPKVLIVDEPTGHTDATSTVSVLSLLKSISQDILVICVSHDEEVKKLADRIIYLKDGMIESDKTAAAKAIKTKKNKAVNQPVQKTEETFPATTQPFNYVLKLGMQNLKKHPVKAMVSVFITTFSFLLFSVSVMLWGYKGASLVSAVFAISLSSIILYNFITSLIVDKKKDVGILRSLGARATGVFGVFMITAGIIAVLSFVFSTILSVLTMVILNAANVDMAVSKLNIWIFILLFAVCEFVSWVATLIPVLSYAKQSPYKQLKG